LSCFEADSIRFAKAGLDDAGPLTWGRDRLQLHQGGARLHGRRNRGSQGLANTPVRFVSHCQLAAHFRIELPLPEAEIDQALLIDLLRQN
jgi:hypothetical protein